MPISPIVSARPNCEIVLDIINSDGPTEVVGQNCASFEWKAMMNGGYMVRFTLNDADYNILKRYLVEREYFAKARSTIYRCKFRLSWPGVDNQTPWQYAYIISLHAFGGGADIGKLEFYAVDPSSWYLNCGDVSGKAYRGKVSDVIRSCVTDYAPGINLSITNTTDSNRNVFWMMRQDPKTFISSLLDWSSSVTPRKTQWLIGMDNTDLVIKEQADIGSQNVGFYRGPRRGATDPNVRDWETLCDNALSLMNTKLVTNGISAIAGQYLDKITDADEEFLFAKDVNTPNKYKARTSEARAFSKPPDAGPPRVGWTSVHGIPEIYSAGDLGRQYEQYIDGRPRALWLNMVNMVQRARFCVLGHGVYSNSIGLGTNTVTFEWIDMNNEPFFLSGNWIVYGFWHKFTPSSWMTHLYCARADWDSEAIAVP